MVTELLQVGPYMKRPWTLVLGAIALLAGAYVVPAARAESPLDDLIAPKIGNSACFTRVYDADHLRKHPKQTTTSMAVWLAYEELPGVPEGLALGLGLAISRKGDSLPLFAQGGCVWDERANRNTSDRRMIKEFKKEAGAGCMTSARPDVFDELSAEEGGYVILDPGKDSKTLTVYLEESLTMVKQADRAKQLDITFGADDRVFLLRRAEAKVCDFVARALSR
jgi:hypothetical protein